MKTLKNQPKQLDIKIEFPKRRMRYNLIFGIFWLCFGLSYFIFDLNVFWLGYFHLIPAFLFLIQYWHDSKHQYLSIQDGFIQKTKLLEPNQKIRLETIDTIVRTDIHYILKSKTKVFKINPSLIDKKSLLKLIKILKQLDLPEEKNMFSKFNSALSKNI